MLGLDRPILWQGWFAPWDFETEPLAESAHGADRRDGDHRPKATRSIITPASAPLASGLAAQETTQRGTRRRSRETVPLRPATGPAKRSQALPRVWRRPCRGRTLTHRLADPFLHRSTAQRSRRQAAKNSGIHPAPLGWAHLLVQARLEKRGSLCRSFGYFLHTDAGVEAARSAASAAYSRLDRALRHPQVWAISRQVISPVVAQHDDGAQLGPRSRKACVTSSRDPASCPWGLAGS